MQFHTIQIHIYHHLQCCIFQLGDSRCVVVCCFNRRCLQEVVSFLVSVIYFTVFLQLVFCLSLHRYAFPPARPSPDIMHQECFTDRWHWMKASWDLSFWLWPPEGILPVRKSCLCDYSAIHGNQLSHLTVMIPHDSQSQHGTSLNHCKWTVNTSGPPGP